MDPGAIHAIAGDQTSRIWLACEGMQHTGSITARSVANVVAAAHSTKSMIDRSVAVAVADERTVEASLGLASAWAARAFGTRAVLFVSPSVSVSYRTRAEQFGACIFACDNAASVYDDRARYDRLDAAQALDYREDPMYAAGASTVITDICAVLASVDTVVVPVGTDSSLAGIATAAADGGMRIVGVEAMDMALLHSAIDAGEPVTLSGPHTSGPPSRLPTLVWDAIGRAPVDSLLVTPGEIVAARQRLWDEWKLLVSEAGATGFAAIASGAIKPLPGETVVVVLTDANTPTGLATASGREG
ncbi:pyridoxal-phosphate dependent enzyme [Nocardia sp. NPDC052566]|uniref:pyridoxal-phosphate dependent enzyme n=1 Tax=Nocardia sp. NPDC052566 TaxID=3364330 RepID=UPI0037C8E263